MAGEHRLQMPPAAYGGADEQAGKQRAKPEKLLNGFVRLVALIERLGNALGTLAFTWATVVLLGGYPTVLRPDDDFWLATTIVFLEGARMFSDNNRLDYQLFFNTRGAFRPLGWNGLILVGFYTSVLVFVISYFSVVGIGVPMLMIALVAVSRFLFPGLMRLLTSNLQCCHTVPVWSSLLPFVFWGLSVFENRRYYISYWIKLVFLLLFAILLLLAISTLKFPCITKLVGNAQGSKQIFWHRVVLNLCMLATGIMFVFMIKDVYDRLYLFIFEVSVKLILSLGNLQIPAAMTRVVLAAVRLLNHDYYNYNDDGTVKKEGTENLLPSLKIFYGMVLGQGMFYGLACMLELSSFVPRRALVHRAGFKGTWGWESVNMYYAYALGKCMEKDVLVPNRISLAMFATDSLKSKSTKRQFHGIRILHCLLQIEPTKMDILSKLDVSPKTMVRIIRMLDWTREEDANMRLFAAKVFCEIAKSFRLGTVPGTAQLISTLLDVDNKPGIKSMLFDVDDEVEGNKVGGASQEQQDLAHGTDDDSDQRQQRQESVHHDIDSNLLATEVHSNHQVRTDGVESCIFRCWKRIIGFWSIPREEPLADQDILPALGMSILCNLACNNLDNCMVISRTVDLIPKIIWFTSYRNIMQNTNEVQQEILMASSLKLLLRLVNTSGEVGIALRQTIAEHPVLLSNLTNILDGSSRELKRFAVQILRNLAIDGKISTEIGHIQMIVKKLIDAFLSQAAPSSANWDPHMEKVAGQALAMLTMESVDNCATILMERENLVEELTSMICESHHKYVVAQLLQNLLLHIQSNQLLSNPNLRNLCEALPNVLETCMDAKTGAELESFVGLSSQICNIIPADFAQELEKGQRNKLFVNWLVKTLNENMHPTVHCPGIRRALIQQAIYLMKYDLSMPNYSTNVA